MNGGKEEAMQKYEEEYLKQRDWHVQRPWGTNLRETRKRPRWAGAEQDRAVGREWQAEAEKGLVLFCFVSDLCLSILTIIYFICGGGAPEIQEGSVHVLGSHS